MCETGQFNHLLSFVPSLQPAPQALYHIDTWDTSKGFRKPSVSQFNGSSGKQFYHFYRTEQNRNTGISSSLELKSDLFSIHFVGGKMQGKVEDTRPKVCSMSCFIRWRWLKSRFWGSTWVRKHLFRIQGISPWYFIHWILGFQSFESRILLTLCGGA